MDEAEWIAVKQALASNANLITMGRLVNEINHEFNNLLYVMSGYLELIKSQCLFKSDVKSSLLPDYLSEIQLAVRQSTKLVQGLLQASHRDIEQPGIFDLSDVLIKLCDVIEPLLPKNIKLLLQIDKSKSISIQGDPHAIRMALMNLILNARDACGEHGEIQVQCATCHLESTIITVWQEQIFPGDYALIKIIDDGIGIEKNNLQSIVQADFTTKTNEQVGLGLSIARAYILKQQGVMQCQSSMNEGTIFEIYLPRVL